jgi:hypothetical protein
MSRQDNATAEQIRREIVEIVSRASTPMARREIQRELSAAVREAAGVLKGEPVLIAWQLRVLVAAGEIVRHGSGARTRYTRATGPGATDGLPER